MDIDPVESYVLSGFEKQCSSVFNCRTIYKNSIDSIRAMQKTQGVKYPYLFITSSTLTESQVSYNSNRLARQGIQCIIGDDTNTMFNVRLVPTDFELQLLFTTNSLDSRFDGSVGRFQKQWMFARRAGKLKFNINYGNLQLRIGCEMSESIETPELQNKTEQASQYECTSTVTVHGYVSDTSLKQLGIVNHVDIEQSLGSNAKFIPFQEIQ